VYRINPFTGEFIGYLCVTAADCTNPASELAYDPSNQHVFGLSNIGSAPALVQMVDKGLLPPGIGPPGSHEVAFLPIGTLGVTGIRLIEFVPGLGLYGTDGTGAGYQIDEVAGQARPLAPLSGVLLPITGLAYNFDTQQLFASGGNYLGSGPGVIYRLDPLTGHLTVLNPAAADLVGIAFVTLPEGQPVWMLLSGLTLCGVLRKRVRPCDQAIAT
jgi:hypothetical protein